MFLSGSHSGLTAAQADNLEQSLQDRADFEHAKITFSRSEANGTVTLMWTVVMPPTAAPGTHAPAGGGAHASVGVLAATAFRFFVNGSWDAAQAAGLLGNIEAESGFDASMVGDHGAAFGLCQWHGDRQAQFRAAFGHSIQESSFDEQLAFVNFELLQGNETRAGMLLKAATTASEAGRIVSMNYERPGNVQVAAMQRAALADKWFNLLAG